MRSRLAVSTIFLVNGVVLASWVPHIPAVKAAHALSDGALGLVLLAMAVGAVLALPLAGWLVGRAGSRRVTTVAALALCGALPLPVLSPDVPSLALSLLFLGACNATLDVAMNAQAVAVEQQHGRAIMSSFHGLFSLWGLAGAAVAGGLMALGIESVRTSRAPRSSASSPSPAVSRGWCRRRRRTPARFPYSPDPRACSFGSGPSPSAASSPRAPWATGAPSICTTPSVAAHRSPPPASRRSPSPWRPGASRAIGSSRSMARPASSARRAALRRSG